MANAAFKALHLYTSPFSGCSARVRITAFIKNIPLVYHDISISTGEQSSQEYLLVNPNASVPALVIEPSNLSTSSLKQKFTITQSPAILDFLELTYPSPALIPGMEKICSRARVMELTSLVACDIQPPQNSRIRRKIKEEFGGNGEAWARYVYERGLGVYETFVERHRLRGVNENEKAEGRYSVGDEVTMADVFLVPAVQGALRVGVGLDKYPLVKNIVEECWKMEAFKKGGLVGHGRLVP